MRKKLLVYLMAGLVALALAGWFPAVAQITTGGITGTVVDEKGDPLPGVLITARNRDTGLERAVTTDAKGEYHLLGLPPAVYVVQATISGYGAPLKTIVVNLGQLVPLSFEMRPGAGLREEETVTAEPPLVNTTKAEVTTVVTEREVRSFPLFQRDYNDLAQLAPGVKQAAGGQFDPTKKTEIYQPFTTGGSSGRNVNISIDGADNNDNVVGFFVQGFTTEAIQEFEVVQDQYKAEYGRSLGGVVNVITKSGTNDLTGSAFGYLSNESLRAKSYSERLSASEKPSSDREFFGFSVGGPIIKDRLFYFAALERQNRDTPVALSNDLTQYAGTEPASFPFQISRRGTTVGQNFERDLWTVKFDWNISKDHLLWVRWSRDNVDFLNDQGGALTDPTNQGNSKNDAWSGVLNWQWNIGGNMINELKIHRNDFENRIVSTSPNPILSLNFDQFSLGRNGNTPQATFQKKFQIRDDFSWVRGRHTFKGGIEGIRVDMDPSFLGPPTSPALSFTFNAGIEPADTMDPNGLAGISVIDEITPVNPGFIPGTRYYQYGLYFQDDWEMSDRWRFNLGLRADWDVDIFKDAKDGINADFYNCISHPGNPGLCGRDPNDVTVTGFMHEVPENKYPEDQLNFSPRIGFVYRVGGEDKDVLRGSWGLFYDKLIDNLVIFMRQNLSPYYSPALPTLDGCDDPIADPNCTASQLWAGTSVDPRLPVLPVDFTLYNWQNSVADANGYSLRDWYNELVSILGPATFDDIVVVPHPDWQTPYTSAYSVGWGHVFSPRLALDTNLVYRRGFHQLRRQDYRGRTTGRDAPMPANYLVLFTTDGKYQFVSLQTSLKGRWPNFDWGVNMNLSQALGTQDNAGTIPTDGGPLDIFEGGNIRYTGGNIDTEWGRVTGDQMLYVFGYGQYRFPLDFQVTARVAYGTKMAFQGFSGVDTNADGFNSGNDFVGARGTGLGDDLFFIDFRGSKFFDTGKGTKVEIYADVFNLTNRVNHGVYVIHQQMTTIAGARVRNPDYQRPTGDVFVPPRTLAFGARFTW